MYRKIDNWCIEFWRAVVLRDLLQGFPYTSGFHLTFADIQEMVGRVQSHVHRDCQDVGEPRLHEQRAKHPRKSLGTRSHLRGQTEQLIPVIENFKEKLALN
ncbi:hypothetical protein C8J57DRAFT_1250949 [Mycena rebaudengoi]|nr:hypothetical protein C8J57DRAFT_1250949 [Mycena rebaudengoi]